MRLLGVDPGPHTGWAIVDFTPEKEFKLISTGIEKTYRKGLEFLQITQWGGNEIDKIICEDYIINPKVYGHSHQGDRGDTLRLIGALEYIALVSGIEIVLQMPTIKPAGYGFLNKTYVRGKRDMHGFDALAHLAFYLVTRKGMKPIS